MPIVLIAGAGSGLSASLARAFHARGLTPVLAARDVSKLTDLARETGAITVTADASTADGVAAIFDAIDAADDELAVAIYNPSYRVRGPIAEVDPAEVQKALQITAYGAFLVGQQAARRMLASGGGTILFTGASAGVKGYPLSAAFAMGKFALRGLAQSMARELHPKGVHVAHVVIDGMIRNPGRTEPADKPDSMLDPDAIAETYVQLAQQDRSIWTWEVEVRPWVENF